MSVNWEPWTEIGSAAQFTEHYRAGAFYAFKPEEVIKAFELALAQTHPQIFIANINWQSVSFNQAFLSELTPSKKVEVPILLQLREAIPSKRKSILIDYLQLTVGSILGMSSIDAGIGFSEAGMDSLMTEELYEKLQTDIGSLYQFPVTVAFDYPSILKLTQYFEEHVFSLLDRAPKEFSVNVFDSLIKPIQPQGNHFPLFCFHGVDGGILGFMDLAKALGADYPLFGIESLGYSNRNQPFHTNFQEMITDYIKAIQTIQPQGPYHLGGFSMGGIVSAEIAFQLERQGQIVNLLFALDSLDPYANKKLGPLIDPQLILWEIFKKSYNLEITALSTLSLDAQTIKQLYETNKANINFDYVSFKHRLDILLNNGVLIDEYVPRHYDHLKQACLFKCKTSLFATLGYPSEEKIKINIENFEEHTLDCEHFTILRPPHINLIADILKNYILQKKSNQKNSSL